MSKVKQICPRACQGQCVIDRLVMARNDVSLERSYLGRCVQCSNLDAEAETKIATLLLFTECIFCSQSMFSMSAQVLVCALSCAAGFAQDVNDLVQWSMMGAWSGLFSDCC
jgi:hypothetical protein